MRSSALRARRVIAGLTCVCAGALLVSCGSAAAPPSGPATGTTAAASPAGTSSATTAATAPGGSRPCPLSALRVTIGAWNGAGAGNFYRALDFTNISAARCTMRGYPGVSFVTARGGTEVGATAERTPAAVHLVLLAPHAAAHATLRLIDVLNFGPQACSLTTAHWLRVYSPDQFTARYVAWTARVCSGSRPVFLFVGPVQAGP